MIKLIYRAAVYGVVLTTPCRLHLGESVAPPPSLDTSKLKFELAASSSGGAIVCSPQAVQDAATRDALRAFGKWIAANLASGHVAPLVALSPAPQTVAERLRTSGVAFHVVEESGSIRIELIASSLKSREAIHDYLRAASGGSLKIERAAQHRGNNLGWDAPTDRDVQK